MTRKRRARDGVRVRVPEDQSPFFFMTGKNGGWFISLTWNYGAPIDISWSELRRMLAGSKGEVIIARRLEGDELAFFQRYTSDIDHEVHARLIFKDHMRWRRPARGKRRQ